MLPRTTNDKRPGNLPTFDDSPNAYSKGVKVVEGSHTHGRLNEVPAQPTAYTVGVAEDMGSRRTMEDAYSFVVDYAGIQGQGFFAIFDGHAGKHAAEWCGQHFHEQLLHQLIKSSEKPVPETMADTFLEVDSELTRFTEGGATNSGCTAAVAFLRIEDASGKQSFAPALDTLVSCCCPPATPAPSNSKSSGASDSESRSSTPVASKSAKIKSFMNNALGGGKKSADQETPKGPAAIEVPKSANTRRVLYTANAGDARAVLSRKGRAVRLTYDHKGNDKREVRRIQEAGGFVLNNRVNGVLAVTRSLGDSAMKEYVVGSPYTSEMELTNDDEFLIIACDGLWDVVEDQSAVDLVQDTKHALEAARKLVQHALDNFSHDNVTVLVVKFNVAKKGFLESAFASS
ncbi:Protein phosphatase 2C 1 [Tulasnella sp. 403]|nr:Protein phosphatase 2C 1 [Tulasnella sp. 403]